MTRVATATASARDQLVDRRQVEAEAHAALEFHTLRLGRLRAVDIALMTCIGIGSPTIIAAIAETYGAELDEPWALLVHVARIAFGTLGLSVGVVTWLLMRRQTVVQAYAQRQLAQLAPDAGRPMVGKCPHCGGPLRLDGSDATPLCQHCGTQLWVAFGRMIEWSTDAAQRAKRWKDVARETYFRVELPTYRIWFMPVLVLIILHALAGSLSTLLQELL